MRQPGFAVKNAAVSIMFLTLAGCSGGTITITSPVEGSSATPGQVAASVSIGGGACASSFQATLDGVVVTQQFSPQPPASATTQASFNLVPGEHLLKGQRAGWVVMHPGQRLVTFLHRRQQRHLRRRRLHAHDPK